MATQKTITTSKQPKKVAQKAGKRSTLACPPSTIRTVSDLTRIGLTFVKLELEYELRRAGMNTLLLIVDRWIRLNEGTTSRVVVTTVYRSDSLTTLKVVQESLQKLVGKGLIEMISREGQEHTKVYAPTFKVLRDMNGVAAYLGL